MKIYGTSVLKGLLYTLKTFVDTYVEDFKRMSGKGQPENGLRSYSEGVVTVQYPEAPMPIGATYERFRVLPMLIYDKKENEEKDVRCTSCGICAKVCPPQCIWIVQQTDEAGKPVPKPDEFFIDTSVCMNCGLCSEFCPFDAIKMDHQFELTLTENRREGYVYDIDKLLVPAEYYAKVRPQTSAAEDEARRKEEEAKKAKEEAKKAAAAAKAAAAKAEAEAGGGEAPPAAEGAEKPAKKVLSDEEKAAMKEAALKKAAELKAKKAAEKAAAEGGAPVAEAAAESVAPESPEASAEKPAKKVLSDEEKAALKEAALKKAAELKAKKAAEKAAAEGGAPVAETTRTEDSTPPAETSANEQAPSAPEKETEA